MKKGLILIAMSMIVTGLASCDMCESKESQTKEEFKWIVDRFDDVKVLRYQVPGFEELPLDQKQLVYYLSQSALCGRDIIYDQNFKYNLPVRRTLEAMYVNYKGDRDDEQWLALEKYLKKVWFANGVHHHYSEDKFVPEFTAEFFDKVYAETPAEKLPLDFGPSEEVYRMVRSVIFDPELYPVRVNQAEGQDLLLTSAMNYYEGVTQREAEAFYAKMANPRDKTPISYGLNSKLVKEDGKLQEKVWRVGGMYSKALEKVVYWLEKAAGVANETQKPIIEKLIEYYKTGDLRTFDQFNIMWVQDTLSNVDYINGFTETYGDPLGYKASWESIVNFKDQAATRRTELISANAQWFENNSPIQDQYKKKTVKGVSAKVINAAMLGGDCYPATPIGVNLPNADWIRKDHGSKSVTIQNITTAYAESDKGSGILEEFVIRPEDRERIAKWGTLADNLHTDLHECLGHGSGQLAPRVKGDELKQYGSVLEEARADLFALYYIADIKLMELGIVPNMELYKAEYTNYIINGLMKQLARVELGKNIEQTHMRNRQLVSSWVYEKGMKDNVIEKITEEDKTYFVINDFEKLRSLFGELLREVQRIKSEGDFRAGKALVETYGVKIDQDLHREVLDRYDRLNIQSYSGFVNPEYHTIMENGEVVDIIIGYPKSYTEQMLSYSEKYSYLSCVN